MKYLTLKPAISHFDHCRDFAVEFGINRNDLILTNRFIFEPYFGDLNLEAQVLYQEDYGSGEPSDEMAEAIGADIGSKCDRVIAIGGGTVLDLAKLFALQNFSPIIELFDQKRRPVRERKLVLVPTTCGTGSEVTNISILEIKSRQTKKGLAADELYADHAVLVPKLLDGLPYRFFAASSIDALIHAVESSVSPKATPPTRLFGYEAIRMILGGYLQIARQGTESRFPLLGEFLLAGHYAGIAFGNAGVGAVHAMSYPLSGKYHVAHGEANYALFTEIFKFYTSQSNTGELARLNRFIAGILDCDPQAVYQRLDDLLNAILPRIPLTGYGVTRDDLREFTNNVMHEQGRLMANNFCELTENDVLAIYLQC